MAKYRVTVAHGRPGQSKNATQNVEVEAGSESVAMKLAVAKFKNANPGKEAEATKAVEH